jgi:hypothetical protein
MLAPVVRGGAAGVLALLKRAHGRGVRGSLANAAERFLRRQVELEDASPFDAAPAARAEHAARMIEAQGATAGPGGRVLPGPTNRGEACFVSLGSGLAPYVGLLPPFDHGLDQAQCRGRASLHIARPPGCHLPGDL